MRRAQNKGRWAITVWLSLSMAMAACGPSESGDTTAITDTTVVTEGSDSTSAGNEGGSVTDEEIELVVWGPRPHHLPPDLFAGFMDRYSNITVTTDLKPDDDMFQQMQARQDVGEPLPDLIFEDSFLVPAEHEAGLVLPADECKATWEAEDPESFASLPASVWDDNVVDGETLGATLSSTMDVIFYNVPWLEEAGIDPASIDSFDAMLEAMRTMKSTRPDGIPFSIKLLPTEGVTAQKAMMSAAGTPFDAAVPDLHSPGGLYILQWHLDAADEGLVPAEAIAWEDQEVQGSFFAGRAGFIVDGFTSALDYHDEPGFDYGTDWSLKPLPISHSGEQEDGSYANHSKVWVITSGTDHPYETCLLIRYINEVIVDMTLNGSYLPRDTEALEDPRLSEAFPYYTDEIKEAFRQSEPAPVGLNAGAVELILEELFGEIVVGTDLSAEELADKYQSMLDGA